MIEPKSWALASDMVVKGDVEAAADKSIEVNPLPLSVVPGDKAKSPVAAIPAVVEITDSNTSPPSVTLVFSWDTSSSPRPSVFAPSRTFLSAGFPAAAKTPSRRGHQASRLISRSWRNFLFFSCLVLR